MEDGPVPSLDGLNIAARVQLQGDLPRGVVYILMPWPNAAGEMPVRAGVAVPVPAGQPLLFAFILTGTFLKI